LALGGEVLKRPIAGTMLLLPRLVSSQDWISAAMKMGYTERGAEKLRNRLEWLTVDGLLQPPLLQINPYDKRFELLLAVHTRQVLRSLMEFGPIGTRQLARLLRLPPYKLREALSKLEVAGLVEEHNPAKGEKTFSTHTIAEGVLERFPRNMRSAAQTILQTVQSGAASIYCLIFTYWRTPAELTAISRPSPEEMHQSAVILATLADKLEREHRISIANLTVMIRSAWLEQLLGIGRVMLETYRTFDSPPLIGAKPRPEQLFEAEHEVEPPTEERINNWLKRKLITQTPDGYQYTERGIKVLKFRIKLQMQWHRTNVTIGNRRIQIVYH
jgi:DNA-binding MarR family transcriptional regulator